MANALNKIRKRAEAIRKKHPGKKYQTALKEAGREYRTGKLKTKRRRPVKAKRKKATRRRRVGGFRPTGGAYASPHTRETVARTRSRVGSHKRKPRRKRVHRSTPRRRRVGENGSSGSSLMPILLLGGLGVLAYAVFRGQSQAPPPVSTTPQGLNLTGNQYRDQTTQKILAWATAGGLAIDAISKLIQALNSSSDATVNQVADSIDSGEGIPYGYLSI